MYSMVNTSNSVLVIYYHYQVLCTKHNCTCYTFIKIASQVCLVHHHNEHVSSALC